MTESKGSCAKFDWNLEIGWWVLAQRLLKLIGKLFEHGGVKYVAKIIMAHHPLVMPLNGSLCGNEV